MTSNPQAACGFATMTFNRTNLTTPAATLVLGLLLAIALTLVPQPWTNPLRGAAATVLRPGQHGALAIKRQGDRATRWITSHFQTAARLVETRRELQRLKQQNQRLTAELDAARAQPPDETPDDATGRLLQTRCVGAHVLGRQARAFLSRQYLLDVGSNLGIEPEALVVDGPAVIDRGSDADLKPGQLVLNGRRVWGKIVQLGPYTSTVRAATEPGFRDLVRLGGPSGTQGILEGTGGPLARIRLVEVTEPVSIGDAVYTAAGKGAMSGALLYGRIVRLKRPIGAAHWEIWMQPAVTDEPEQVAVLKTELNPLRVAEKEPR